MDLLLDDLGLDGSAKLEVARQMRQSYGREFRVDGSFERQLGSKYRKERRDLEKMLDSSPDEQSAWAPGSTILNQRSSRMIPIANTLKELEKNGQLTVSIPILASSFLHMHANRMLRSAARAHELILYDFLTRTYESRLARSRKGSPQGGAS